MHLAQKSKSIRVSRKKLLAIGIIANIMLLAYFKYSDFFIQNTNIVFASDVPLLHLALPLAISFFTFQQIANFTLFFHPFHSQPSTFLSPKQAYKIVS